jgi:hypothetical protein
MGRKIKQHAKSLERIFSRSEWEYLKRHPAFKLAIKKFNATEDETLSGVDALSILGECLLQTWEDANPKQPRFGRVKPSKRKPN